MISNKRKKEMVIRSFLFGSDKPVELKSRGINPLTGHDTVVVVINVDISTPCGTIHYPAGARLSFDRVEIKGDVITPITRGRICLIG
jgi:hypothetical protein